MGVKNPLFSRYRQGENRVTASILAVFERIDPSITEQLLTFVIEEDVPLISYTNQLVGSDSVPDASISASFTYLFEIKTESNAVDLEQLGNHLKHLTGKALHERLFLLTPDAVQPLAVSKLAESDPRIVWFNFFDLDSAIESALSEPLLTISELQRYLLRELQALFDAEGLLAFADVVVVPAREGYLTYLAHGAYVCQPNRTFKHGLSRMAFYANGEIKPSVPRILLQEPEVELDDWMETQLLNIIDHEAYGGGNRLQVRRAEVLLGLLQENIIHKGEAFQLFLLTSPSEPETVTLRSSIKNTSQSESGRIIAWVRSQRYVTLTALESGVMTTTALDQWSAGGCSRGVGVGS